MSIRPDTSPARNVIAGWLGRPVPPIPKHRNQTRAGYRKTPRKRARTSGREGSKRAAVSRAAASKAVA